MEQQVTFLTPLHHRPTLSPIAAFDTETYGPTNDFQLCVFSAPDGDYVFTDAQEVLDFFQQRKFWSYQIFATNLGFDAFALFQAVTGKPKLPDGWSIFHNGSKIIWIKKQVYESGAGRKRFVTLLDSLNITAGAPSMMSVAAMGGILQKVSRNYSDAGRPDLAAYFDEAKMTKPKWLGERKLKDLSPDDREYLIEYCASDARVTRKFMEWFQIEVRKLGGELQITAASTAMDLFRRRFMRAENRVIPQPSIPSMIDSKFAYYGGRTEDFVKGRVEDVWEYDFASMYPSAMVECRFPYTSPEKFVRYDSPNDSCLEYEGFSKVTITIPTMDIPPLPFRFQDKLLFPIGTLIGVWTNLELRYAQSLGCEIEEIHWTYYNPITFNPFEGYVKALWQQRLDYKAKGMATEEVIKLFLNSLYGKFGQNFLTQDQAKELGLQIKAPGGTYKAIEDASEDEIVFTGQHYPDLLAKGYVVDKSTPKLKAFMNNILSCYVTARGRIKLHEAAMRAMQHGARVLYCDTDSLYVTKRLPFASQEKLLGALEEKGHYQEIVIVGPKMKRLVKDDGTIVATAKGVPFKSNRRQGGRYILAEDGERKTFKPREELFLTLFEDDLRSEAEKFLSFREALVRDKKVNEIVDVRKQFDPFAFPKRKLLGFPRLKDLVEKCIESVPWEIDRETQNVLGLIQNV